MAETLLQELPCVWELAFGADVGGFWDIRDSFVIVYNALCTMTHQD